jgi:transcriptional regulator with XRE-family HTH domain
MKRQISKNIASVRLECNLTQKQLGEILGKSGATIARFERGLGTPSIADQKKFEERFGFPLWKDYRSRQVTANIQRLLSETERLVGVSKVKPSDDEMREEIRNLRKRFKKMNELTISEIVGCGIEFVAETLENPKND